MKYSDYSYEQIMKDSKVMNVIITSDNKFLWNGEELQTENLEDFFASHAKEYPDGLLIQADDDSEHGSIVRVMDSARNSGIKSISLARG